jgi:hypothetical protein
VVQEGGDKAALRDPSSINVRPFLRSRHKKTNRFIDFTGGAVKGLKYHGKEYGNIRKIQGNRGRQG